MQFASVSGPGAFHRNMLCREGGRTVGNPHPPPQLRVSVSPVGAMAKAVLSPSRWP